MRRLPIALLFVLFVQVTQGQTVIKGKITNTKGETIPFASIIIANTTIGVSADENGNYSLKTNTKGSIILKASSAGYITLNKRLLLKNEDIIEILKTKKDDRSRLFYWIISVLLCKSYVYNS